MNRKRVVLAALLGVLFVCVLYAYFATPRLEKAPPRSAGQGSRTVVATSKNTRLAQERIDFAFLTSAPQDFPGAQRDLFRFGRRLPVRSETPAPELPVVVEMPAEVPVMTSVPFETVQTSLAKFTFLGFLDKAGEKTVFLSSDGSLFLVKKGENFGANQEFLVVDISDNLLQVRHAGRSDLVGIQLIEQQKLSASVSAPARIQPDPRPLVQPKTRIFNPKRKMVRPDASQESDGSVPEITEENYPEEGQETEAPAAGDVLEGEVNGSNQ